MFRCDPVGGVAAEADAADARSAAGCSAARQSTVIVVGRTWADDGDSRAFVAASGPVSMRGRDSTLNTPVETLSGYHSRVESAQSFGSPQTTNNCVPQAWIVLSFCPACAQWFPSVRGWVASQPHFRFLTLGEWFSYVGRVLSSFIVSFFSSVHISSFQMRFCGPAGVCETIFRVRETLVSSPAPPFLERKILFFVEPGWVAPATTCYKAYSRYNLSIHPFT